MTEQQTQYDRINLIGHTSLETAFCIDDYPYGRFDRCKKFIWIEKATKGAKKGWYRPVYVTTNPKKKGNPLNKPNAGQYALLAAYYINQAAGEKSDGYIMTDCVHSLSEEGIRAWAERNKHLMDNSPETREEVVRYILIAQRYHINHALWEGRREKKEFVEFTVNGSVYRASTKEPEKGAEFKPEKISEGPKLWEEFNTPWMVEEPEKKDEAPASKHFSADW